MPTILCVDDDAEILEVLKEYFTRQGFHVVTATNGVEAMFQTQRCRQLPRFAPRDVLLDISMPGFDGVETLRRLKDLARETPVVMVSAIEDRETARQTLVLGATDYVAKPVDFQYLDSVLQVHLFMSQI